MVSKEIFCDWVRTIRELHDASERIGDAIGGGFCFYESELGRLYCKMESLFYQCFFTKEGFDLIDWWLFDSNEKKIFDANDHHVIAELSTEEDLFDYIASEKEIYLR